MKVEKTLVGWVVILIILWTLFTPGMVGPYTGFGEALILGVLAALGLFILSIVCTLGLSLFIWIPLGFGVGTVVFGVFGWGDEETEAKPVEGRQQPKPKDATSLTREQQAVLIYVKKARARGLTKDEIMFNLKNNGWIADDINWAFDALK